MLESAFDSLLDLDPLNKVEISFGVWSVFYIAETLLENTSSGGESKELEAITRALSGGTQIPGFNPAEISKIAKDALYAELALVIGFGWIMVRLLATGHRRAFSLFLSSCYFSLLGNLYFFVLPGENSIRTRCFALAYFILTIIMIRNTWIVRKEEGL